MPDLLRVETSRIEPDITVLSFAGKIVLGPDSMQIEMLVFELLKKNQKKFIFDLSRVYYVDSTGMGVIASCFTKAAKAGGGLRLAGVSGRVRELFKITRLDSVVGFYPTVLAASENFTVKQQSGGQAAL